MAYPFVAAVFEVLRREMKQSVGRMAFWKAVFEGGCEGGFGKFQGMFP
jgi:hypothetical protein